MVDLPGEIEERLITPSTTEAVASRFGAAEYLFAVYAGSPEIAAVIAPLPIRAAILESDPLALFYLGHITPGDTGKRGHIVSMVDDPWNFSPEQLQEVLRRLRNFGDALDAGPIGLAGRIPGLVTASRIPRDPSFVMGIYGSVYAVVETLETILVTEYSLTQNIVLGVVGTGFFGRRVFNSLDVLGYSVVGYDKAITRTRRSGSAVLTNTPVWLQYCNAVINLTGQGDEFAECLPYLNRDVLGFVIDDTHPRPSRSTIESILDMAPLYWAGVRKENVRIEPPFPGRHAQEIPGCLLETILRAMDVYPSTQDALNRIATAMEFQAFPQLASL